MEGDKVADLLLGILPNDIKTNYNFIKLSNELGKLSFLPDAQANRRLSAGDSQEDIFASASNQTTINRLVKSILDANGIKVSDPALEGFGNRFKAKMSLLINKDIDIRLVEGDDVRKWYHEKTYTRVKRGTLQSSCMRHDHCQDYFGIYVKNTSVVKLIIKVDDSGNLTARALLWTTDKGYYIDRVYWTHEEEENLLVDWAKLKFGDIMSFNYDDDEKKMSVRLSNTNFDLYPYMDTFRFLIDNKLQTWQPVKPGNFKELCETDGGYISGNQVWSEYYGEYIEAEDAVWSSILRSRLHRDDSIYSEYLEDNIPEGNSVKSKKFGIIYAPNSVKVVDEKGESDIYPSEEVSDKEWLKEESEEIYYHKSLADRLEKVMGMWFKKGTAVLAYRLSENGIKESKEIYLSTNHYATKLDVEVFDFEVNSEVAAMIIAITKSDIAENYRYTGLNDIIELIKNQKCSDDIKEKKISEQKEFDKYLREVQKDRVYIEVNEAIDKVGSRKKLHDMWVEAVNKSEDIIKETWNETTTSVALTQEKLDLFKTALRRFRAGGDTFTAEETRKILRENTRLLSLYNIVSTSRIKIRDKYFENDNVLYGGIGTFDLN
jgi:hypothetical protein